MKKIGYCVPPLPELASYRLRVAIPAPHIGMPYTIGRSADVNFFFKDGSPLLAQELNAPIVYDVVNDHFATKESYGLMCAMADKVTCGSEAMAETIWQQTGKRAEVIDDPYENNEGEAKCDGYDVLWFGHAANYASLGPYIGTRNLSVCSSIVGEKWTLEREQQAIEGCAVVLLTSGNPGASSNRVVKALRLGRFVVAPRGSPRSWDQFCIWIGDVQEGIAWALNNREDACKKIRAGQEWIRERFSPQSIGKQWQSVFASI